MSDSLDSIYKSLRVVPEFDGNPHVLTRFINLCDQIVIAHFDVTPGHDLQNLSLLNGILNKITGPAARLINSQGIADSWNGIRNALINNFADHRDETALYNDLSLQTQGSSTPQEFYERCQNLFSTIITYISLHESIATTIEAKRTLYRKLTLQSYLRGLKEPLGSRIRCMRPDSMEKALEYVQEELNTLYLQQRNEGGATKKDHQFNPHIPTLKQNNFNPPRQFGFPSPGIPSTFRQQNIPNASRQFSAGVQPPPFWKPNPNPHPPPQYRMPTRTQQIFAAPPPNYHSNSNTFRLPNRPQGPPGFNHGNPRPMSGVSHYSNKPLPPSGHDWRRYGNPPPSNYFKSREMNINECAAYDESYYNSYDSYYQEPMAAYSYSDDYYNNELTPDYTYDFYNNYYSMTDESVPQLTNKNDDQDFQEDTNSPKPK